MRAKLVLSGVIVLAAGAILVALLLRASKVGSAELRSAGEPVRLANREIAVFGFPEWGSTNQQPTVRGTLPYVVRCAEHIDRSSRLAVEATGARVVGCLPPDAFQVEADGEMLRRISADPRFAGAAELLPGDKVDARLSEMLEGGAEAVVASVVALGPEDREGLREYVTRGGGELLKGCLNGSDSFRARLPAALVGVLAQRGEVRWLESFSRPKLMNDLAVESAAMNVREVWDLHGLSGKNQVVSTSDSGVDFTHRDFEQQFAGWRAVEGCCDYDAAGHGTHTAGSIIGKGTMSGGQIRGTAWGAKLWAWFCLSAKGELHTPEDYVELFRPEHENWPTYIHSASWGDDGNMGKYDSQCKDIDSFVWSHPDFLPVFSVGNEGKFTGGIASPAAAKNVLAVGATENIRSGSNFGGYPSGSPSKRATYSGRGPCKDGRTKPDVAAPGTGILSTRALDHEYDEGYDEYGKYEANTNYAYMSGTSMATPLTAGAVALVREWLVERCGFRGEPPTAALMKAVITGGAKGVSKPNNEQGWGRVDLTETLYPSNRAVRLIDRIPFAAGTNFSYVIKTTDAAPLDVQLVWIDYPGNDAAADASSKLVNDLDLTVEPLENGAGTVWRGNGGTSADRINTTESVRIETASAGKYKVTVNCHSVTYDHTEGGAAALYIRGALEKVKISVAIETKGEYTEDPSPAVGETNVVCGTRMDFTAPEWSYGLSPVGTRFSRRAFVGFEGTGSAPASGTNRQFSVVVTEDTTVTWKYAREVTDYFLRFLWCFDNDNNTLDGVGSWRKRDSVYTLDLPGGAVLGDPYVYEGWYSFEGEEEPVYGTHEFRLGDVIYRPTDQDERGQYQYDPVRGSLVNSLAIKMDEGVDIIFDYFHTAYITEDELPYWWYMRYLWNGVQHLRLDGSAKGDPDGDGFDNLAESKDLTDPVDDQSFRFRIDAFTKTNMTFTGSIKGKLVVQRSERLGEAEEWKDCQTISPPRASTVNQVSLDGSGSNAFYRVTHRKE